MRQYNFINRFLTIVLTIAVLGFVNKTFVLAQTNEQKNEILTAEFSKTKFGKVVSEFFGLFNSGSETEIKDSVREEFYEKKESACRINVGNCFSFLQKLREQSRRFWKFYRLRRRTELTG